MLLEPATTTATTRKQATTMNDADHSAEREPLRLDQFLKKSSVTGTGGHAKFLIQNGEVLVNGEIETRRRRKLAVGDVVEIAGTKYPVLEN
jgi:ribosome-associated protein